MKNKNDRLSKMTTDTENNRCGPRRWPKMTTLDPNDPFDVEFLTTKIKPMQVYIGSFVMRVKLIPLSCLQGSGLRLD